MSAKVDPIVAALVRRHGVSIEQWMGVGEQVRQFPAEGIVVATEPRQGHGVQADLRAALKGTPYRAELFDDDFGDGPDKVG